MKCDLLLNVLAVLNIKNSETGSPEKPAQPSPPVRRPIPRAASQQSLNPKHARLAKLAANNKHNVQRSPQGTAAADQGSKLAGA